MSFQSAVSKLSPQVQALLAGVTVVGGSLNGRTEKDQEEVVGWIEKVGKGDIVKEKNLKTLDAELVPRTYVVSNYLTSADVALFGALYPVLSKLQSPQYYVFPSITRYLDHIQSCPPVRKSADSLSDFPIVTFDLENAPKLVRNTEPMKKKEKPAKPASTAETSPSPAVEVSHQDTSVPSNKKEGKKEKKEKVKEAAPSAEGGKKKGGGGGNTKAPAAEDDGEPVPSMIDLRVGHIVDVKKHPDADSLYVEQIDIGEETGPRTVVSGLVNYIPIEEMRDKYLICVCNLKPAAMRGIKSYAMVLAATSKDGKEGGVELVQPPPNSKPGDRVYFEDFESGQPLSQLNPKKKIFETIQPGFTTLETREAAWINPVTKSVHRIRTSEGVCVAPTFVGASLS